MKNLNTVNVLQMVHSIPFSLQVFPDDKEGNLKAEELFLSLVSEKGATSYIDVGYWENPTNGYAVYLIHST